MKTLIRNAHVLTFDAQDREYPRADILIDGDRIAAIGPGPLPGADGAWIIEAAGKLAMPGLITDTSIRRRAFWPARSPTGRSSCSCCSRCRPPARPSPMRD